MWRETPGPISLVDVALSDVTYNMSPLELNDIINTKSRSDWNRGQETDQDGLGD